MPRKALDVSRSVLGCFRRRQTKTPYPILGCGVAWFRPYLPCNTLRERLVYAKHTPRCQYMFYKFKICFFFCSKSSCVINPSFNISFHSCNCSFNGLLLCVLTTLSILGVSAVLLMELINSKLPINDFAKFIMPK